MAAVALLRVLPSPRLQRRRLLAIRYLQTSFHRAFKVCSTAAKQMAALQTTLHPPSLLRHPPAFQAGREGKRSRRTQRCNCLLDQEAATPWRQRIAAGAAAALVAAQAVLLPPLEAAATSSPLPAAALEQQQAARPPAALAPDAALQGLPPLPTAFPPLPPLVLPKYRQLTLKNGLRVFLLEVGMFGTSSDTTVSVCCHLAFSLCGQLQAPNFPTPIAVPPVTHHTTTHTPYFPHPTAGPRAAGGARQHSNAWRPTGITTRQGNCELIQPAAPSDSLMLVLC